MLQSLGAFIGRVLRAVIGLAMVAGALALGLLVATGVLLRLAWLRARLRRAASPGAPHAHQAHRAHQARRAYRAAAGEVIDVEVHEVRAR